MNQLLILILGISLIYLSLVKWQISVQLFFVIVILEGAIRKWVFPEASELVYFLKDFILIGAYINYYVLFSRHKKCPTNNKNSVNVLVSMVTGWCIFQVFNPSLGSPIIGLFGLRGYILYIPLMWMIPSMFESENALLKFLRSQTIFLIPVGILGIIQFFSPASSLLNVYANSEVTSRATFTGNIVRVTGTFSFLSGYAVYLIVCFCLLITFFSVKQSRLWSWLFICELFLLIVNSFMTGYRVLIIAAALFLILYFCAKIFTQPGNALTLFKKFLIPSVILTIAALIWFRPVIDAFWHRSTSSDDVFARILGGITQPFDVIKYKQLDGFGTGATHQAAPALRKALKLPEGESIPVEYEPEPGRVALELGPIGFFIWYGLRFSLAIALWNVFLTLKRQFLKQLALSACLIQIIHIANPLVFHHTFSAYYWFFSSFIWLLPKLEQVENRQEEQELFDQYNNSTYFTELPYQ